MTDDPETPPDAFPNLARLGWDDGWREAFAEHLRLDRRPGRVAIRHKDQFDVLTEDGVVRARLKGYLRYTAETWAELPIVGDWVALGRRGHDPVWRIQGRLPRRTLVQRNRKGLRTDPQPLAANVDVVFVVMGLTEDFNVRRLERYLVIVREGGARPVVVLNKADLLDGDDVRDSLEEIRGLAEGVDAVAVSALEAAGAEPLRQWIGESATLVLVGSSGAGKSTLVNTLLGEQRFATGEVRESDGRGRHVTSQRELVVLPGGGVLIDSPGIREIQLLDADEGLAEAFEDIEELAARCRFSDCSHDAEPGCAIREAIENDDLDPDRLEHWLQLRGEAERSAERIARRPDRPRRAFRPEGGRRQRRNRE